MERGNGEAILNPLSARHGRLRRSNGWANAGKVLLTGVIVLALSGISVAAYAVWGLASELKTVDLVVSEEEQEALDAVAAGSQSLDGALTILLVGSDSREEGSEFNDGETGELNDVNLLLAQTMLSRLGADVASVRDGAQALATMLDQRFDLVLMDIQMPELDGFGAARRIRAMELMQRCHTPIVAMTAHAIEGYRERCVAGGMDGYVTKPVDRKQLVQEMRRVLPLARHSTAP